LSTAPDDVLFSKSRFNNRPAGPLFQLAPLVSSKNAGHTQ
jgi:hypothetical protein